MDHFFDPGASLARLKNLYEQERGKWELLEFIFLISFITSTQADNSVFSELFSFEKDIPIVLKISLTILLRTLEKMKIPKDYDASSPICSQVKSIRLSTGKRKRQDELLTELEEERTKANLMKVKLKEREIELAEIKASLPRDSFACENLDAAFYKKINILEQKLLKNIEDFDEKHRIIERINAEKDILNDQVDVLQAENQNLTNLVKRFQDSQKKFENVEKIEKASRDLEKRLKESYQDKELLLIEIQHLRVNSRRVEILEESAKEQREENFNLEKSLRELGVKYSELEKINEKNKNLADQIPNFEAELNYLKSGNFSSIPSQKDSITSQSGNLMVEELRTRLIELTQENERLSLIVKERENIELVTNRLQMPDEFNLKLSRAECDYFQAKIVIVKQDQTISELKKDLLEARCGNEKALVEKADLLQRAQNIEKQYEEGNMHLEKLRAENCKLREYNSKLTSECEKVKNENLRLLNTDSKQKLEIKELSEVQFTLRAEISHLFDKIEKVTFESTNLQFFSTEPQNEFGIPLSEIVKII